MKPEVGAGSVQNIRTRPDTLLTDEIPPVSYCAAAVVYCEYRAVKNMLSESSAASVVYYWLEFRDDLTPQWLKQFTRHVGDIQDIGWAQ